MSIKLVDN